MSTEPSLSQVCERVSVGHVGSTSRHFCDESNGVAFVRSQDVRPAHLVLDNVAYVTRGFHNTAKKSQLKSGDILIVRVGANRGDTCVVPKGIGELNCANIVFARPLEPNGFFGLFFQSDLGQELLLSVSTGSAQGVINTQSVARMPVPVAPLETQRRIATILSAYDDLIENNTQRITALEAAAHALYREWFVEFRFPGHESVKWVDSELGEIPVEWEAVSLREITTKIGSGATPRGGKDSYKASGISLIRSMNIFDFDFRVDGLAFIDEEQAAALANVEVQSYDVLLNITGASVARCSMVPKRILPARVNQHVAIIRVDRGFADPHYVLYTINSHHFKEHLLMLAQGGATREALTKSTIENFKIPLPPLSLQQEFSASFAEFELKEALQHKNELLREARDLLLPRLISGELSVNNMSIDLSSGE